MSQREDHPSKATSWRAGEFVVLPEAQDADETVWFGTELEADGGVVWEGLLAKRTAQDRARICAVPFWLYDLNLGDEVSLTDSADGAPVGIGRVNDAGNFTFRVVFDHVGPDDARWQELMRELERYCCWFDVRGPGFVALSAPPEHAQTVADVLARKEKNGDLKYETGRSESP